VSNWPDAQTELGRNNEDQAHRLGYEDLQDLRSAAHAAAARSDFLAYATYIDPAYQTPDHIRLLGAYLQAVERGDIKRLIITMPPRHGKSHLTSGMFPGWCIGLDTNRVVMLVSHSADLAETFSIQNRDTIALNPRWADVFPTVALKTSRRGAAVWAVNEQRESMIANGIMGGLTGYGAWHIVFDDPVKTYEQAQSPTYRDKVFNEYKSSARTRLTPDGRIIIILTRWHEEDLAGMILNSPEGDNWTVLHLPAFSYGMPEDWERMYPNEVDRTKKVATLPKTAYPDPLKRRYNEPLWPGRWPTEFLQDQRLALGHQFECLYQGNPSAPAGNKFKRDWFRAITGEMIARLKAEPKVKARSYDLSFAATDRSDFTAGLRATLYTVPPLSEIEDDDVKAFVRVEGVQPVMIVLEDLYHVKKEWDENSEDITKTALEDGKGCEVYVEAVAAQNTGFKSLRRDPRLWGHKIVPITVQKAKDDRNAYAVRMASAGFMWIQYPSVAREPDWERAFLDEVCGFPNAANDDIHDALTQLVNVWQPRIDSLLEDTNVREWKAPFSQNQQTFDRAHLPPEFRENDKAHIWVRDKLGWV